jgi:hypothetical protein
MATPPQYSFKVGHSSAGVNGMVNVETLIDADGRYFYAPVLMTDYILRQPLSGGGLFDRGYLQIGWRSDVWRAQYGYLYGTVLQGSLSAPVYFQTLRIMDDNSYSVYLGTLTLPLFDQMNRNYKQYQAMPWDFTRCTRIP